MKKTYQKPNIDVTEIYIAQTLCASVFVDNNQYNYLNGD